MAINIGNGVNIGGGISIDVNVPTPSILTSGLVMNLATAPVSATNGTAWTDTSGSGNNATLVGIGTLAYTGSYGGGITTTGGSYISTGYNFSSNTFTISIAASFNPASYWSTIWADESWSAGKGYLCFFGSAGVISVGSPSGGASYSITGYTSVAIWDFVISGTSVTVFKNGTSLGTSTFVAPGGGYSTTNLYFGARHTNGGTGYTDTIPATFYSMRVYNLALTSTQVTQNYSVLKGTYGLP